MQKPSCLSIFNGGHLAIVIMTAMGLAGTGIGVYTSLNSTIAANSRAITDLTVQIKELKEYNSELRGRLVANDKEMREGLRIMAQKLIDLGKK